MKNDKWVLRETDLQKEEKESPVEYLYRLIVQLVKKEEERTKKIFKKIGVFPYEKISTSLTLPYIKTFRDQIEKMTRSPILELRKSLESSYLNSLTKIHQQIDQMVRGPLEEFRKLAEATYRFEDPLASLRLRMEEMITGHIKELRKTLLYANPLEETLKSVHLQMEYMVMSPIEELKKSVEPALSFKDSLETINKGLSSFQDFALSLPQNTVIVNADRTVTCADRTYNLDELQALINESLPDGYLAVKADSFDKGIQRIVTELRKLRDPIVQKVITYFIIPLIISVITIFLTPLINEISNHYIIGQKKHVTRNIQRKLPRLELEKEFVINYRIVTADILNVREKPYGRSKKIGVLYFGQVVSVIEKRRDWTLVECMDSEGGVIIKGWVFDGYLKKLTK